MQDTAFYDPYQLKIDLSLLCDLNQEYVSYDGDLIVSADIPSKITSIGPGIITVDATSLGSSFLVYGINFGPVTDEEYEVPEDTFPPPEEVGGRQFTVYRHAIRYMAGNAELFKYVTRGSLGNHTTTSHTGFYAHIGGTPILDIARTIWPSWSYLYQSSTFELTSLMIDGDNGHFYAIAAPPLNQGQAGIFTSFPENSSDIKLAPYVATGNATPRLESGSFKIFIDKPLDLTILANSGPTVLHLLFFRNPCYQRVPAHHYGLPTQHLSISSLGKTCKIKQATYVYGEGSEWYRELICPSAYIYGGNGYSAGQRMAVLESRMDFSSSDHYYIAERRDGYITGDLNVASVYLLGKGQGSYDITFTPENNQDPIHLVGQDSASRLFLYSELSYAVGDMHFYPIRGRFGSYAYPYGVVVLGPEECIGYQCSAEQILSSDRFYNNYSASISANDPTSEYHETYGTLVSSGSITATRKGGFALIPSRWNDWIVYSHVAGSLTCVKSPESDPVTIYAQHTPPFTPDQIGYYVPGAVIAELNSNLLAYLVSFRMGAHLRASAWESCYKSIPDHITIDFDQVPVRIDHFIFSLYKNHRGDLIQCGAYDLRYDYHTSVYPWWALWIINQFSRLVANINEDCSQVTFALPVSEGNPIIVRAEDLIGFEYNYSASFRVKISE